MKRAFKEVYTSDMVGSLHARFRLDSTGSPVYLDKADGRRHYVIQFLVDPATSASSVTYVLDPSYYDPILESTDSANWFLKETTSFGDYPVTAKIVVSGREFVLKELLSALLGREYSSGHASEAIKAAMTYIAER